MFAEFNPTGRTGGDKRELSAVLDSLDKLVCLLHDGEIGAEVGVIHLVKAEPAQSGDHFTLSVGAYRHAKHFAQSSSYRRCGLNYYVL